MATTANIFPCVCVTERVLKEHRPCVKLVFFHAFESEECIYNQKCLFLILHSLVTDCQLRLTADTRMRNAEREKLGQNHSMWDHSQNMSVEY